MGFNAGLLTYGYVENQPINRIDPLGLYSWSEFGDDVSSTLIGIGDGASFGLTRRFREVVGYGSVNYCSVLYGAGNILGSNLLLARLGYAFQVARIPARFSIATEEAARAASAARNGLKDMYRGFTGRFYPSKNNFDYYLRLYGPDWAAIIRAAGRPNLRDTAQALVGAGLGNDRAAIDNARCQCQ